MTEEQSKQSQPSPQLIMWVKENGVFKPAYLKMHENYIGHNLERNVELQDPEISPDTLNLVSSVYLGPINIYEEQLGCSESHDTFQRLKEYKHGIASGIVKFAEEVAKQNGVPYFGVTVIQTLKDRTLKFKAKESLFDEDLIRERYDLTNIFVEKNQPQKPLEFVLHPTAQLYVLRK